MNFKENDDIIKEMKRMNKLLALIATQGKSQGEKISLLNQLDFSSPEIGELLGVTPNLVRVTLHQARKKSKKGSNAKSKQKLKD
jgi:DNA-directed RNA polymerase specialized sigma24 family protein